MHSPCIQTWTYRKTRFYAVRTPQGSYTIVNERNQSYGSFESVSRFRKLQNTPENERHILTQHPIADGVVFVLYMHNPLPIETQDGNH